MGGPLRARRLLATLLVGLCGLTAGACGFQLEHPRGEPGYPVEGLWLSADEDAHGEGRGLLLYISAPGQDKYPYKFVMYRYYMRDLMVSGKRMFFTRRTGVVDTSDREVLLTQVNFQSGFRDNLDQSNERYFWPAAAFEPERLERNFGDGDDLDLLKFQNEGGRLVGDKYDFRRALPAATVDGSAIQVPELDVAVVMSVNKAGDQALTIGFSPALYVVDAERDVWNRSGAVGRVKVGTLVGELAQVSLLSGHVSRGDALVMKGWQPRGQYRRKLSREEILRRIQRGEPVPREELLRVIGDQAAPEKNP
jgi:hypothetical protein